MATTNVIGVAYASVVTTDSALLRRQSEFYLTSQAHIVQLELLEFSHPGFTKTYRIVRNAVSGVIVTIDGNPTEFEYYPLRIRPSETRDNLDNSLKIDFGDLGSILPQELDAIAKVSQSPNLILNSDFEIDTNSDGIPDYWSPYIGVQSFILNNISVSGNKSLQITANGLTSSVGVISQSSPVARGERTFIGAGTKVAMSAYLKIPSGFKPYFVLKGFQNESSGSEILSMGSPYGPEGSGIWQYYSKIYTPSLNSWVTVVPRIVTAVGSGVNLVAAGTQYLLDCVQLEIGDAPTEYRSREIDKSLGFLTKPIMKYWCFRSDDLQNPLLGPVTFEIENIAFTQDGASFEAKAPSLNINKTGENYNLSRFPMLRGFI